MSYRNSHNKSFKIVSIAIIIIHLLFSSTPLTAKSPYKGINIVPKRSFIVLPILGNKIDQNRFISELADVIREDLNLTHVVIGRDQTDKIVDYYSRNIDKSAVEIINYLNRANDEFFAKGRPKEAIKYLNKTTKILTNKKSIDVSQSNLLLKAQIAKAKISFDMDDKKVARDVIANILRILPKYKLDSKFFSPRFIEFFEIIKRDTAKLPKGSIKVDSVPAATAIFLNGIYVGITPCTIRNIKAGSYKLLLNTDHRRSVKRTIAVYPNKKIKINTSLPWDDEKSSNNQQLLSTDILENIVSVTASLGTQSGVDRVIMIGVDSKMRPYAKMIDVNTQQVFKDIKYRSIKSLDKKGPKVASYIMRKVRKYANNDIIKLTKDDINRSVVVDSRIHSLKSKPIYKRPLFWVLVGTGIIGGLITGVALSAGGTAASTTGSLNLIFK